MGSDGFQSSMQLWDAYSKKTKTDLAVGVTPSKYAVENPICFNSPERVYGALKVRVSKEARFHLHDNCSIKYFFKIR